MSDAELSSARPTPTPGPDGPTHECYTSGFRGDWSSEMGHGVGKSHVFGPARVSPPTGAPTPTTDEQIEQWKRMSWGHYNAPVFRMLEEITRLRASLSSSPTPEPDDDEFDPIDREAVGRRIEASRMSLRAASPTPEIAGLLHAYINAERLEGEAASEESPDLPAFAEKRRLAGVALLAAITATEQERDAARRQRDEQIADKHRILREYEAQAESQRARLGVLQRDAERMREALRNIGMTQLDDGAPVAELGDGAAADYFRAQAYSMAQDAFDALALRPSPPPGAPTPEQET
jgi:hypothetical protein